MLRKNSSFPHLLNDSLTPQDRNFRRRRPFCRPVRATRVVRYPFVADLTCDRMRGLLDKVGKLVTIRSAYHGARGVVLSRLGSIKLNRMGTQRITGGRRACYESAHSYGNDYLRKACGCLSVLCSVESNSTLECNGTLIPPTAQTPCHQSRGHYSKRHKAGWSS